LRVSWAGRLSISSSGLVAVGAAQLFLGLDQGARAAVIGRHGAQQVGALQAAVHQPGEIVLADPQVEAGIEQRAGVGQQLVVAGGAGGGDRHQLHQARGAGAETA
jgi:hypothetical protein